MQSLRFRVPRSRFWVNTLKIKNFTTLTFKRIQVPGSSFKVPG